MMYQSHLICLSCVLYSKLAGTLDHLTGEDVPASVGTLPPDLYLQLLSNFVSIIANYIFPYINCGKYLIYYAIY